MTSLAIDTSFIYSATSTEALQWRITTETGTHRAKITDTHALGKIYTRYFNICSVACVQFREFSTIMVLSLSL